MAEASTLPDSAGIQSEDNDGDNNNIGDCSLASQLTPPTNSEDGRLPDSSSSEGYVGGSGRKLQKNDSGIDVEKSPSVSTKDGLSDVECGDSVSEGCVDSAGFSLSHSESVKSEDSPSQVEEDEGDGDASFSDSHLDSTDVSPNETSAAAAAAADFQASGSVHMETADGVSSSDAGASGPEAGSHLDENDGDREDDDDDDDDDDDNDDVEAAVESASSRRKRRRVYLSSSDSDSSDDSDDNVGDEDDEDDKEMETGEKTEEEAPKGKPKHKWRAVEDLRKREIGASHYTPPSVFREQVQGSLQMVQRLLLQHTMEHHTGCVNALHFNQKGDLLASGSDDLHIVLWNWKENKLHMVYDSGHRSNVFQAKFMPFSSDCLVVSCARDGQVRLAETSSTGVCKDTRKLAQHKGAAHKLALEYSSDKVFLSCGEDALTYQIDLREDKAHKLVVTKENDTKVPLYSIHSNPVNSFEFCTGGRDHYIRVYDKRKINENVNGGVVRKYCPPPLENSTVKANVTCACFNHNGTEILGTYNDEDIYLFDNTYSDRAAPIHHYDGHRNNATVKGVSFYGPRSEFIVSGSDCGHIFMWDKDTEQVVQFLKGDESGVVNVLEPHPSLPVLATSGLDHNVKVWAPMAKDICQLGPELISQKRKNRRARERDRYHEPEMIDGQMLWFIMHHFRRSARRRLRQEGEEVSTSSENSDGSSDEGGEDGERGDRMQCQTS